MTTMTMTMTTTTTTTTTTTMQHRLEQRLRYLVLHEPALTLTLN